MEWVGVVYCGLDPSTNRNAGVFVLEFREGERERVS
jgi:hypothetical protein